MRVRQVGGTGIRISSLPHKLGAVSSGPRNLGAFVVLVLMMSSVLAFVSPVVASSSPTTLTSPSPRAGGLFGASVAVLGNTIIVGAPGEPFDGIRDTGNAYVFDAQNGSLIANLTSPNVQADGLFGSSVAVEGNTVVVGAYNEGSVVTDTYPLSALFGNAYVFDTQNGTLLQTLTSPKLQTSGNLGQGDSNFGWSLGAEANTVVVGAPYETSSGLTDAGNAYLFAQNGTLIANFTSPNAQTRGLFGYSVAVNGDTVVVGAPYETSSGLTDAGSAYIFAQNGTLLQTLTSPNPESGGNFGYSIAIDGNTVVVGAPGETSGGLSGAGSAYLFAQNGTLIANFTSPNAQTRGFFGSSIATDGSTVIVGAYEEASGGLSGAGNVYAFDAQNGILIANLTSPNPESGGNFGYSIAIDGNTVVVGAPGETSGGLSGAGSAYIFALPSVVTTTSTTTTATTTTSTTSTASSPSTGPSISIASATAPVGANDTVTGQNFTAPGTISVSLGTTTVSCADSAIAPNGTFACLFTVPALSAGGNPYSVLATDSPSLSASTNSTGSPVTFRVEPSIYLANTSVAAGARDNLSGNGFTASGTISVTLNGSAVACAKSAVGSDGSFICDFTVPSIAPGNYSVVATDSASVSSSATNTGVPVFLTVSPLATTTATATSTSSGSSSFSGSVTSSNSSTMSSSSSGASAMRKFPYQELVTGVLAVAVASTCLVVTNRKHSRPKDPDLQWKRLENCLEESLVPEQYDVEEEPQILAHMRGVDADIGNKRILSGINLDIRRGEIMGILGRNGAGKTTLLSLVSGLRKQSAGDLTVLGQEMPSRGIEFRARMGFVLQEDALYQELTVAENLKFSASLYEVRDPSKRISEVLEILGLSDRANQVVSTLSGGLKRRTAIARAFLHDPELFIVDEPTLGVDADARHAVWSYLRLLRSKKRTVIVATNYLDEALALCDRVAVLDRGRLLAVEEPRELVRRVGSCIDIDCERETADRIGSRLASSPMVVRTESTLSGISLFLSKDAKPDEVLREFAGQEVLEGFRLRGPDLSEVFKSFGE